MRFSILLFFCWYLTPVWAQETNEKIGVRLQSESELLMYITNTSRLVGASSDMTITQEGDNNAASVYGRNLKLNQNGSYQQTFINETSLMPSNMQVNVEGRNSYVEIVGSNNILNNARLTIKGDNRSVIIRNYR